MMQREAQLYAYADTLWPDRTWQDRLRKLGEEIGELMEASANGDVQAIKDESADICMLLTDLVHKLDGSHLSRCFDHKMVQNEKRFDKELTEGQYGKRIDEIIGRKV